MNIVLVGFMGTGKSAVGARLARRLGWSLVDTDALIVEAAGCTIPEIFSRDGEAGFRDRESAAVSDAAARDQVVIATGGGIESGVWRQILADVLGLPLQKSLMTEQAGVGAALLAGVGTGMYESFEEAGGLMQHYSEPTEPVAERRALYDALYAEYQALYPKLREDFHTLSDL